MELLKAIEIYPYIFLSDFLRYFIAASAGYLIFWVLFIKQWQHRIIQKKFPKVEKMWFEFRYSMSTVVIFSIIGFGIVNAEHAGYTKLYSDMSDYGWPWLIISFGLIILLHDAYFYWAHRFMHHPKVFRHVHLVHHKSTNPSPWAAYSFHPLEAVIEAAIFPIIVFIIPVHNLVLVTFLIYMITRNVIGHMGIEVFPKGFTRNKWINWHTTTTHHDLHHKNFKTNYGLYFTWWDKWFGTEDKAYESTFEEVTTRKSEELSGKSIKKVPSKGQLVAVLLAVTSMSLAQSPAGYWQTYHEESGTPLSTIHIEETANGLEGSIAKIFLQPWEGPDPVCTKCTGQRKNQKVIGMTFMWGFDSDGKKGKILDPASGTVYDAKMWLDNDSSLTVRGYAGPMNLLYRSQTWLRDKTTNDGNSFTGTWKTIDDETGNIKSLVSITKDKEQLSAKILKIYLQPWEGENPICLKCPGEKQNAPIVGMKIMGGFAKETNKWSGGKILDPGNGKTYASAIWMEDDNTLKIRGYWGPFYRTQVWKRVEAMERDQGLGTDGRE